MRRRNSLPKIAPARPGCASVASQLCTLGRPVALAGIHRFVAQLPHKLGHVALHSRIRSVCFGPSHYDKQRDVSFVRNVVEALT